MKYNVIFEKQALDWLRESIRYENKDNIDKLYEILEELKIYPTTGIGNPEQLRYSLYGKWSRRINENDRILYEIVEERESQCVVIISVFVHCR